MRMHVNGGTGTLHNQWGSISVSYLTQKVQYILIRRSFLSCACALFSSFDVDILWNCWDRGSALRNNTIRPYDWFVRFISYAKPFYFCREKISIDLLWDRNTVLLLLQPSNWKLSYYEWLSWCVQLHGARTQVCICCTYYRMYQQSGILLRDILESARREGMYMSGREQEDIRVFQK